MTTHAFDTSAAPTVCPFMPVFGAPQVMFVRGSGTELWDINGKRYLDFLGGLAVIGLGHSHPRITAVIAKQAATLMHVSNLFANDKAAEAAIKLDALLAEATGEIGQVFFCNSGAEANETALKLARKFGGRGRHGVISAFGSFHGRTLAALGGHRPAGQARAVLPDARRVPARGLQRHRRARGSDRSQRRRRPARAGAG